MSIVSFEEAIKIITAACIPFEKETIQLEEADGRILAETVYADRDYPPFNRAAMDGYALMQSDWQQGIRNYTIIETIFTGKPPVNTLVSGTCYKIMTGAATPEKANLLIRKEDAGELKGQVQLTAKLVKPYMNIAKQGEDTKAGTPLLFAPAKCSPQVIGLLATIGQTKLQVYKRPRVAIITTGDEVVCPRSDAGYFQIRNSNQYLLRSLLKQWGIQPMLCQHVSDQKDQLTTTLITALKADLVIINGGVSAGDADHVPAALHELGVEVLFHKVSIRPGKPLLVGKAPSGALIFALPGNPLSCLTTFTIFVEHYLSLCFGFKTRTVQLLPLLAKKTKKHPSTEFFPVSITPSGGLTILPNNGSGDVTATIQAQGLAMQPAAAMQLNKYHLTAFFPFSNIH